MKKLFFITVMSFAVQFAWAQATYEKSIELQGGPALDQYTKYSVGASTTHGARIDNFSLAQVQVSVIPTPCIIAAMVWEHRIVMMENTFYPSTSGRVTVSEVHLSSP